MNASDHKEFKILLARYLANELSPAEVQDFLALLQQQEYAGDLQEGLENALGNSDYLGLADSTRQDVLFKNVMAAAGTGKIVRTRWWQYAVAAAVLVVIVTGILYYKDAGNKGQRPGLIAMKYDLPPGSNKAVLTLADGSTVLLNNTDSLITAGTGVIRQSGGELRYQGVGQQQAASFFNVLTTPRGGKYRLLLPDGTRVWLNAASSLRYPTAFSGTNRKVELSGEAYFEVAAQAAMPFKVIVNGRSEINVLGTSFNINAYTDEAEEKTTLVTGAISVRSGEKARVLSPGQQGVINTKGDLHWVDNANIAQVIAWKNDAFSFQDRSLAEVMRQLSRWYDIEVVYEKGIPQIEFFGEIGTNLNLSQVLHVLESAGVKFRMEEGKKLVVMP